jgi:hypothetical protein
LALEGPHPPLAVGNIGLERLEQDRERARRLLDSEDQLALGLLSWLQLALAELRFSGNWRSVC